MDVLAKLVRSLNNHLPAKRKTLAELLKEEKPSITSKDGSVYTIAREELEFLRNRIPEYEWNNLKLPIIIEMNPDLGNSARVRGRIECSIIRKLLDTHKGNDSIILYYPEILELRKKLPTSTQYGFFTTRI